MPKFLDKISWVESGVTNELTQIVQCTFGFYKSSSDYEYYFSLTIPNSVLNYCISLDPTGQKPAECLTEIYNNCFKSGSNIIKTLFFMVNKEEGGSLYMGTSIVKTGNTTWTFFATKMSGEGENLISAEINDEIDSWGVMAYKIFGGGQVSNMVGLPQYP